MRFAGLPHPSVAGCAPSERILQQWLAREAGALQNLPGPSAVAAPAERGAVFGVLDSARAAQVAARGARTWPVRESGGNIDIKEFSRGARAYFPVHVEGANFSVGDLHFSQGDGKVAGFGGIKMAGWLDLRFDVIEKGMERLGIRDVVIESTPVAPRHENYITFQGVSVHEQGDQQRLLDVRLAYGRACRRAMDYLERAGYAREQAYVLLSAAPIEGKVSCLVEYPNVCVTLSIPTSIFGQDMSLPRKASDQRGRLARPSTPD